MDRLAAQTIQDQAETISNQMEEIHNLKQLISDYVSESQGLMQNIAAANPMIQAAHNAVAAHGGFHSPEYYASSNLDAIAGAGATAAAAAAAQSHSSTSSMHTAPPMPTPPRVPAPTTTHHEIAANALAAAAQAASPLKSKQTASIPQSASVTEKVGKSSSAKERDQAHVIDTLQKMQAGMEIKMKRIQQTNVSMHDEVERAKKEAATATYAKEKIANEFAKTEVAYAECRRKLEVLESQFLLNTGGVQVQNVKKLALCKAQIDDLKENLKKGQTALHEETVNSEEQRAYIEVLKKALALKVTEINKAKQQQRRAEKKGLEAQYDIPDKKEKSSFSSPAKCLQSPSKDKGGGNIDVKASMADLVEIAGVEMLVTADRLYKDTLLKLQSKESDWKQRDTVAAHEYQKSEQKLSRRVAELENALEASRVQEEHLKQRLHTAEANSAEFKKELFDKEVERENLVDYIQEGKLKADSLGSDVKALSNTCETQATEITHLSVLLRTQTVAAEELREVSQLAQRQFLAIAAWDHELLRYIRELTDETGVNVNVHTTGAGSACAYAYAPAAAKFASASSSDAATTSASVSTVSVPKIPPSLSVSPSRLSPSSTSSDTSSALLSPMKWISEHKFDLSQLANVNINAGGGGGGGKKDHAADKDKTPASKGKATKKASTTAPGPGPASATSWSTSTAHGLSKTFSELENEILKTRQTALDALQAYALRSINTRVQAESALREVQHIATTRSEASRLMQEALTRDITMLNKQLLHYSEIIASVQKANVFQAQPTSTSSTAAPSDLAVHESQGGAVDKQTQLQQLLNFYHENVEEIRRRNTSFVSQSFEHLQKLQFQHDLVDRTTATSTITSDAAPHCSSTAAAAGGATGKGHSWTPSFEEYQTLEKEVLHLHNCLRLLQESEVEGRVVMLREKEQLLRYAESVSTLENENFRLLQQLRNATCDLKEKSDAIAALEKQVLVATNEYRETLVQKKEYKQKVRRLLEQREENRKEIWETGERNAITEAQIKHFQKREADVKKQLAIAESNVTNLEGKLQEAMDALHDKSEEASNLRRRLGRLTDEQDKQAQAIKKSLDKARTYAVKGIQETIKPQEDGEKIKAARRLHHAAEVVDPTSPLRKKPLAAGKSVSASRTVDAGQVARPQRGQAHDSPVSTVSDDDDSMEGAPLPSTAHLRPQEDASAKAKSNVGTRQQPSGSTKDAEVDEASDQSELLMQYNRAIQRPPSVMDQKLKRLKETFARLKQHRVQ